MAWILSAFADEAGGACEEQIKGLRQAGLRYIDIRSIDGHNISSLPVEQAKVVRGKLDAAGIKVNMFGSPLGKIDLADDVKIDIDKLKHMAALAPVLGCNAVRIFSYYNRKAAKPRAEFQREALARLRQLAAVAADTNMVLYHENEAAIFGEKLADVQAITREVRTLKNGKPATFRMIFDFGNYNVAAEDVWANWVALRETTDAFHLKDNARTAKGLHHVPVGHGGGRVREILTDAVARGWDGPLTVEPHLHHSPAVLATGPTGLPNQELAKLGAYDVFILACAAAKKVCADAGAVVE